MKIDFHSHSVITKRIGFEFDYFKGMVDGARRNELDALVLTEHFNTLRFEDVYTTLERELDYTGHYFPIDGLRLYPGMEVDVAEGVHILLFGPLAGIREVRKSLSEHTDVGTFVPFAELLARCREHRLFINAAHPLRPGRELLQIDAALAREVDLVDLNAKDLYTHGPGMRERVETLAAQLGLPVAAGSDAHHYLQLGSVWNVVDDACESAADIVEVVKAGRHSVVISDCLTTKVEAARIVKKTIKEYRLSA